jgi:DNA-binding transcriptional LysR family regulator
MQEREIHVARKATKVRRAIGRIGDDIYPGIRTHIAPKTPVDLAKHDCVIHEGYSTSDEWEFITDKTMQTIRVPSRLTVNLGEAAVAAAVAGAGISRVLSYLIEDLLKARSLVTLLDAYEPSSIPVSVLYPSQRQVPPEAAGLP